jgi:hypothetical protein
MRGMFGHLRSGWPLAGDVAANGLFMTATLVKLTFHLALALIQ